jgi:hypothetical protein
MHYRIVPYSFFFGKHKAGKDTLEYKYIVIDIICGGGNESGTITCSELEFIMGERKGKGEALIKLGGKSQEGFLLYGVTNT